MSSFLQRSSSDAVQVAMIAALGVLLLFLVRLGEWFFVYFNTSAKITLWFLNVW